MKSKKVGWTFLSVCEHSSFMTDRNVHPTLLLTTTDSPSSIRYRIINARGRHRRQVIDTGQRSSEFFRQGRVRHDHERHGVAFVVLRSFMLNHGSDADLVVGQGMGNLRQHAGAILDHSTKIKATANRRG